MEVFLGVFIFLFGTAIGSFLNVVILRYQEDRKITGRSSCPHCRRVLTWEELIPLFSFVLQRGCCRSCGAKISWQYPIVECITGVLFLGVWMKFFDTAAPLYNVIPITYHFIVISFLVVLTVIDWNTKLLPDRFVFTLIVLGGFILFIDFQILAVGSPTILHIFAGPLLFAPFALLWLVSRGSWMGFGDAKLAWGFGWLLGLEFGLSAVVYGFWIGALYFLVLLFLQKALGDFFKRKAIQFTGGSRSLKMKSEVPFGPFLILGYIVVFFTEVDVLTLMALILG